MPISSINREPIVVGGSGIEDGSVIESKLHSNSVATVHIKDGAVSASKLESTLRDGIGETGAVWEQGSIGVDGVELNSNNRIRMMGGISRPQGSSVVAWCDEGYEFSIVIYGPDEYVRAEYWHGSESDGFWGKQGIVFGDSMRVRFVLRKVDDSAIGVTDRSAFHLAEYPPNRVDMVRGSWVTGLIGASGGLNRNYDTYKYARRTGGFYHDFVGSGFRVTVADGYAWRLITYQSDRTFVTRTDKIYGGTYEIQTEPDKLYRFQVHRLSEGETMTMEEIDEAFVVQSIAALPYERKTELTPLDQRLFLQLRHLKGSALPRCTSLLHFSDIHGNGEALARIMSYATDSFGDVDDVVCTGDLLENQWENDFGYWQENGANGVLLTMGNHDEVINKNANWSNLSNYKTMSECYDRFMEPFISEWGVTYTSGKTYYYKDYEDIRLVVLDLVQDAIANDDEQLTWFVARLGEARTAGKAVVVAEHYPPANREPIPNVGAWYGSYFEGKGLSRTWTPRAAWHDAIEDFKEAGGEFVCWIAGHTHNDLVCRNANYPEQIFVVIDTATPLQAPSFSDTNRTVDDATQDLFNIIGFDTVHKNIRLLRIGASENMSMASKKTLCINYQTLEVLGRI